MGFGWPDEFALGVAGLSFRVFSRRVRKLSTPVIQATCYNWPAMRTNTILFTSASIAALALFGWGCGAQDSPVSLDKYQAPVSEATDNSLTAPQQAPATDSAAATTTETVTPPPVATSTPEATAVSTTTKTEPKPNAENMIQPETLAFPGILPDKEVAGKQVHIKTNKGDIVFELLPKEGPKAASNFVYLISRKFYDGLLFHRVEPGFVIQGGDPLTREPQNENRPWGTGGPGYKFEDDKVNLPYKEGVVAMANAGANTNGSQFFIMLGDTALPPNYSIFGRVTSGMDVVKKIAVGDRMMSVTVEPLKK